MNWIFTLWKRTKLNQTKSLDFKMWLESETIISSAVESIQKYASKIVENVKSMRVELHQLKTNLIETYIVTDKWGNKSYLNQPAFTIDEVARHNKKKVFLTGVIILFILAEIVLYYLISEQLAGNFGPIGTISLAIVFALFVLLIYSKSLTFTYDFFEAKEKFANKKITISQYHKALFKLVGAIIMFILGSFFLLYAGLGRVQLIEGANSASMTDSIDNDLLKEVIEKGGKFVSIMAMLFTFGMAILLAFLKKDLLDASIKLKVYKAWKKNIERQENIVNQINTSRVSISNTVEVEIEISQQLGYDLMRIYGEVIDSKNKELYNEFKEEHLNSNFKVTTEIFNKYQDISMVDNKLLAYAIKNRVGILDIFRKFDDLTIKENSSTEELYKFLNSEIIGRKPEKTKNNMDLNNENELNNVDSQLNAILN